MYTPEQLKAATDRVNAAQLELERAQGGVTAAREAFGQHTDPSDIDRLHADTMSPLYTRLVQATEEHGQATEALRQLLRP